VAHSAACISVPNLNVEIACTTQVQLPLARPPASLRSWKRQARCGGFNGFRIDGGVSKKRKGARSGGIGASKRRVTRGNGAAHVKPDGTQEMAEAEVQPRCLL
jgi:hypothetical protein